MIDFEKKIRSKTLKIIRFTLIGITKVAYIHSIEKCKTHCYTIIEVIKELLFTSEK